MASLYVRKTHRAENTWTEKIRVDNIPKRAEFLFRRKTF
jgi:hypothetical protein